MNLAKMRISVSSFIEIDSGSYWVVVLSVFCLWVHSDSEYAVMTGKVMRPAVASPFI